MRLKPASLIVLVSALSVGIAGTARTQDYDQLFKKCYTESLPDHVIATCSAVISRGAADKADLATAFKNRGNAHDDKGEYARALEDYDQAVTINPLDADAFNSRGTAYAALARYERAVLDFDEAIRLNPTACRRTGSMCRNRQSRCSTSRKALLRRRCYRSRGSRKNRYLTWKGSRAARRIED